MASRYWVVMPAAGAGRRMGVSTAKQYLPLAGRTVIEHAAAPFLADPDCAGLVIALADDDQTFCRLPLAGQSRVYTTVGGAQRRDSVLAGLRLVALKSSDDPWVLVHDAARPCLSAQDLAALLQEVARSQQGAILGLRVADTLKRASEDGQIESTVPRESLWRAQTPQAFRLQRLITALEECPSATDESSAIEAMGGRPQLVAGSPDNLKITEAADLPLAERILAGVRAVPEQRVGFGIDVHAFGPGDHVWLGGVRVEHDHGVVAHSDGDVILHALCDAMLGAVALGDIGQHFPDTDPRWKNAASVEFVRHVLGLVRERGFELVNVDVTVLAEAPRLSPVREQIRSTIAQMLGLGEDRVNLKATTTERLGYLGRREGLAAEVVVLVRSPT